MKHLSLARGCRAWCQRMAWKDSLGTKSLVRIGLGLTLLTIIPGNLTWRAVYNKAPVNFSHYSGITVPDELL